jgi:hypothetical protein
VRLSPKQTIDIEEEFRIDYRTLSHQDDLHAAMMELTKPHGPGTLLQASQVKP